MEVRLDLCRGQTRIRQSRVIQADMGQHTKKVIADRYGPTNRSDVTGVKEQTDGSDWYGG